MQQKLPPAVDRCIQQLRAMIVRGDILPGEKLGQSAIADQLGVSRIPVREALKVLESEWVVTHTPNVGYTVARFDAAHLGQVYLMRTCLEPELIKQIRPADAATISRLRALNADMEVAGNGHDYHGVVAINREFHFTIFALSPLDLLRSEVKRLWDMSDFYRSLYSYDPVARQRVLHDHELIIDALERGDVDNLIARMQDHRDASRAHVEQLLRPVARAAGPVG